MSQTSQATNTNAVSEPQRGLRYRVLIVEDDADIRELIRYNLSQEGFVVEEAADGTQALEKVKRRVPDLLLLDLMLPGMPGLQVCRQMRAERETAHLPILIVTAKGTEVDKVLGLEMGADDYVVKPFSPRELVARVKALLRRANPLSEPDSGGGAYEKGRLRMDFGTYQVFVDGKRRELALREFELLKFFVQHPMRVYTREQLLDMVWGRDTFVEPRTVDVHVRRLRQHIERDDANPELILTVRSVGYRFNPEALG
ncbi:MAG TPA: response regulator [Candidatus Sulfotelmatobacter sp.]|jgi:two-component system, OmpR family, alkaline phosphatase synthesis response regulator PhoP|nr:response regulator [Candidatus Sulfotelmatobacter sp.]